VFEHLEVLRDGLDGDRERLGQLVHCGLPLGQPLEDRTACGIGERRERAAELIDGHGRTPSRLINC
jgi:hypothetical protein